MLVLLWWPIVVLYLFGCNVGSSLAGEALKQRGDTYDTPPLTEIPSGSVDPVTAIRIIYPANGAIEKAPVVFKTQIEIRPGSETRFNTQSEEIRVCVEVNGEVVNCSRMGGPNFQFRQLGNCTGRVYLTRVGENEDLAFDWASQPISFMVVDDSEFHAHMARTVEANEMKHRVGFRQSLVEWAHSQWKSTDETLQPGPGSTGPVSDRPVHQDEAGLASDLLLIVGVRTAVGAHFAFRQAIRETWASDSALPPRVKVLFLGCRPFPVTEEESGQHGKVAERRSIREAVELEKRVYGDLLTDELDCLDSYARLADKTKEFFHVAATRYPRAHYVMVADDDQYLRLDVVATRLERQGRRQKYYAGQVRAIENAMKIKPIRNRASRNYLSTAQYPLTELPPFALGANFFLSTDCAHFVAKNRRRLRDLGGMDDISVSLWMLSTQVHPIPFYGLEYLSAGSCRDDLVSLSDLSESAIRVIHDNIQDGLPFCHGFQRDAWLRQNIGAPTKAPSTLLSFFPETLSFEFSFTRSKQQLVHQLSTTISTSTRAGVKVLCSARSEPFQVYTRKLCAHVRLYFPSVTRTCTEITDQARLELNQFYQNLSATEDNIGLVQLEDWALLSS